MLGAILEFLQKDISKDLAQIALVTYSLSVLRLPQGELLAGARHDTVTHFLLVSSQDWITSK